MNYQKISPLRIRTVSVDKHNSIEQTDRITKDLDAPTYESQKFQVGFLKKMAFEEASGSAAGMP
jgi:hypothetical protein